MQAVLRKIARVFAAVSTLALWIAGTGLVAMTVVVGWQVFGRYVLNSTPTWSEPLTLQLMGWFIVFGAAVGVRENFHLGLDLIHHISPAWACRVMDAVTLGLIAAFGAAMSWYSTELAIGTWTATLPSLGIPGGFDYLPQAVGGVLIAAFSLERLAELLAGVAPAEPVTPVQELV